MCWIPPANWTDKAKSIILPTSLCGKQLNRNISCAGPAHGATVSPDGTANALLWARNTWVNISTFTVEAWTWFSHTTNVKLHRVWLRRETIWFTTGCTITWLPSTDRRWARVMATLLTWASSLKAHTSCWHRHIVRWPSVSSSFKHTIAARWTSATKPCKLPKRDCNVCKKP